MVRYRSGKHEHAPDDQTEYLKRYEKRCRRKWSYGKQTSGRVYHLARPPIDWNNIPDDQETCLRMHEERIRNARRQEQEFRKYNNPRVIGSVISSLKNDIAKLWASMESHHSSHDDEQQSDTDDVENGAEIWKDIELRLKKAEEGISSLRHRTDMHRKAIRSIMDQIDEPVAFRKSA